MNKMVKIGLGLFFSLLLVSPSLLLLNAYLRVNYSTVGNSHEMIQDILELAIGMSLAVLCMIVVGFIHYGLYQWLKAYFVSRAYLTIIFAISLFGSLGLSCFYVLMAYLFGNLGILLRQIAHQTLF